MGSKYCNLWIMLHIFVLFTCLIGSVGATGDDREWSTTGKVPSFSFDINKRVRIHTKYMLIHGGANI